MILKSLQQLALIGLVLMVAGVGYSWGLERAKRARETTEGPGAAWRLDCRDTRRVGFPSRDGYVLRLALFGFSRAGVEEALLDAVEVQMGPDNRFEFTMGYATIPDPQQTRREQLSGTYMRETWQARIPRRRRLPPAFDGLQLLLKIQGVHHGQAEGMHLLTWRDDETYEYRFGHGSTVGSAGATVILPEHSAAMQEDVPIARMYLQGRLALFAVVTRYSSPVVAHPHERAEWRKAFQRLDTLPDLMDREDVAAAVEALAPVHQRQLLEEGDFQAYGPLLDSLTAAWVLGDARSLQEVRGRFAAVPGLLAKLREGVLIETSGTYARWFQDQMARPWLDFVSAWMNGSPGSLPDRDSDLRRWGLRLLELTDDPGFASRLVDSLGRRPNAGKITKSVLEHDALGQTEATRAEYARLRRAVVGTLDPPWSLALRSPVTLVLYCLLVPLLALWVFFLRTWVPSGEGFRITRGFLFLLWILSFVGVWEFPLRVLAVPIWWLMAFVWLQGPFRHGFFERALIWLALTLVTVDALQVVGWYVKSPPIDQAASWGLLFCWILMGFRLVREERWYAPGYFLAFVMSLLAVGAITTFGQHRSLTGFGVLLMVFSGITFLVFVIRGDDSSLRGLRVRKANKRAPRTLRASGSASP